MSRFNEMTLDFIALIRSVYREESDVPLHRPLFIGNEIKYLHQCIESNFVSSAGEKIAEFEEQISKYVGAKYAVATVNGTSALHLSLRIVGVSTGDEVLTQSATFVATSNAIKYCGAQPVFIDIDMDTLGLSPQSLRDFLTINAIKKDHKVFNKITGNKIAACIPMHTFGLPCRIEEILEICREWSLPVVEDSAESLGSFVNEKHTGTFGHMGILSFNGNKVITTGQGGMIITDNEHFATKAKFVSTTAKMPHPFEYFHSELGYNYRLASLNAALGCAQFEQLESFLAKKRLLSDRYKVFFDNYKDVCRYIGGHWLFSILFFDPVDKSKFIEETNKNRIFTRPLWHLNSELPMYADCVKDQLVNSKDISLKLVNIPSSVPRESL